MTFKEKLQIDYPELVDEEGYCEDCPEDYGYEGNSVCNNYLNACRECWDRIIPGTEDKEMTKDDLKDGMVCEQRNGELMLWLNGALRGMERWCSGTGDDLKSTRGNEDNDIVKIYKTDGRVLKDMFSPRLLTLIWERKEPKEMTMEEIESALGYPVKIVSTDSREG